MEENIFKFWERPSYKEIHKFLSIPRKTVIDLPIDSRTANNWKKKKLIQDSRKDKKGWHKFSFINVFQLLIYIELRNFAFPLEQIADVAAALTDTYPDTPVKTSEMLLLTCLSGTPSYLAISPNGTITDFNGSNSDLILIPEALETNSYIVIHLNPIVEKLLPFVKITVASDSNDMTLTLPEQEVLNFLRNTKFEEIKVVQNDKETRIEGTTFLDVEKRLGEILKSDSFQTIEIITENSKVKSIRQTVKKKIKNTA